MLPVVIGTYEQEKYNIYQIIITLGNSIRIRAEEIERLDMDKYTYMARTSILTKKITQFVDDIAKAYNNTNRDKIKQDNALLLKEIREHNKLNPTNRRNYLIEKDVAWNISKSSLMCGIEWTKTYTTYTFRTSKKLSRDVIIDKIIPMVVHTITDVQLV